MDCFAPTADIAFLNIGRNKNTFLQRTGTGSMLRRYWFKFSPSPQPSALNLGCGVTAGSAVDAERMICQMVFPVFGEREVAAVVEDIDIQSLDEHHVRPNMGNPAAVGVWFPRIA
ncbi:hypothetical protein CO666_15450 [Rhizobium chutanense]|uniref:Uncharacterized protein n=1 Tax=Rhizobium chutanense TaxID=2035448 RepID=A0A2A6JBZ7_9HYPH|nr:hypothetical protein CO666_15450 [Rhizobium chutanense]